MANESHCLIIRHLNGQQFAVSRQKDGKLSNPVLLTGPDEVVVPDRPDSNLSADLRWYLERFLDYPFEPNTAVAERIQQTLRQWGQNTFEQLFSGQALLWYDRIRTHGLERLVIKIASDDPSILAWPWEALRDPYGTTLAHTVRLERQLGQLNDPQELPEELSTTQLNILMVIARPYGDEDVGFHAISGPLVEWVAREKVAVCIDVLRPPTFEALQQRLQARPGYYHIVHFDGHGGYGNSDVASSQYQFGATEGLLVFEDDAGNPVNVGAQKLTALLTEYRIPVMVLNACRSAGIDARAADAFASTAASLLKAGVRSVVAMGYNLYVSGAEQFVPAFYQRLLHSGDVAEATRAGRKAMLAKDLRACARGEYPLQDWLVPVLYQQDVVRLPVQSEATGDLPIATLPQEARSLGEYGFIGRQNSIHHLERALQRRPAAAILIHGIAGVGKTTLARGFLHWLQHTGALTDAEGAGGSMAWFVGVLWFGFDDIRSAEFVVNRVTTECFGYEATALPLEQKLVKMIRALREQRLLMVWDNFESVAGIDNTEVLPLLTETDRALLKRVLRELRGGHSKVLITSRSAERWLAPTEAFRLPLQGLHGEDVWIYCNAVVRDLGLKLNRSDQDCVALLQELEGHPLALRAVLLRLVDLPPRELLKRLKQAFEGPAGDESTRRIFATLDLLNQTLPNEYGPILELIGLHERYVNIGDVAMMMGIRRQGGQRRDLDACFEALERAGLLQQVGDTWYQMHPALHGFLSSAHPARSAAKAQFVGLMADLANELPSKPFHKQREQFAVEGANLQVALPLATALNETNAIIALIQAMAKFAYLSRDFTVAARLYEELASRAPGLGNGSEASPYNQLGVIAAEQRDWPAAERWFRKSLAVGKKFRNETFVAHSYHHLGIMAEEQRNWSAAKRWYRRSLAIKKRLGQESGAAAIYHQLGMVAHKQGDFAAAESWYRKSLAIKERTGDESGASGTFQQLGLIAQQQGHFATAERWYLKSLAIDLRLDNEDGAAMVYHQLGTLAQQQGNFSTAERWYLKSLAIKEPLGDEQAAARTYHQLGMIAQQQHNFPTAESWYIKSLAIERKIANEHGASGTYHQLGKIAQDQGDFQRAGESFLAALIGFAKVEDEDPFVTSLEYFVGCLYSADTATEAALRAQYAQAGLEEVCELAQAEADFMNDDLAEVEMAQDVLRNLAVSDPDYQSFVQQHPELAERDLPQTLQAELMRETTALLAQLPDSATRLRHLKSAQSARRFDAGVGSIPILLAAAFLLRTHLRIKRSKEGKWEVIIEHRPADSSLVKQLLAKIAQLLS